MLLKNNKLKFFKSFANKKNIKNKINKKIFNKNANFSVLAAESGTLTQFQVETARRLLHRLLKKKAYFFNFILLNTPVTKKPNETRLGRGKGSTKYWSAQINKGDLLFEIYTLDLRLLTLLLTILKSKIPISCSFAVKHLRWTY